jgi:glycosyltransferase involved in cell wall biosynthesis
VRCVSVVVPVYDEPDNIGPCVRALAAVLEGRRHEILICYDYDADPTLAALANMVDRPASVRLVKNSLGPGVACALRAGFAETRGDVVVTTMADLSDPPRVIPHMVDKVRGGATVVSGSRYMRGGAQTGAPWLKQLLSRSAGLSLRHLAGFGTHDATTNFRAYDGDFVRSTMVESTGGFAVALELTTKAHLAGGRVDEVPSTWIERSSGTSHFRLGAWLPSYLRWYAAAMAAPMAVWLSWLGLSVATLLTARRERVVVAFLLSGAAFGGILLARTRRGRMRFVDVWVPFTVVGAGSALLEHFLRPGRLLMSA